MKYSNECGEVLNYNNKKKISTVEEQILIQRKLKFNYIRVILDKHNIVVDVAAITNT